MNYVASNEEITAALYAVSPAFRDVVDAGQEALDNAPDEPMPVSEPMPASAFLHNDQEGSN